MIHIKRFHESVIQPQDYSEILNQLRHSSDITLDELNDMFDHLDIEFVDIDYFISTLKTQKEIELVPSHLKLGGGVRFAAPNQHTGKVYVCVFPDEFISSLNGPERLGLIDFIEEMLRHESIHIGQFKRRPNFKQNFLERSPSDPKRYFSSTDEIMAYADSFIFTCRRRGMSDDDIINAISTTGQKTNWILDNVYDKLDPETRNRFRTYVYEYLRGEK